MNLPVSGDNYWIFKTDKTPVEYIIDYPLDQLLVTLDISDFEIVLQVKH